jgi:hypothetical protein
MALRAVSNIQHFVEREPAPETDRVLIPAGEEVDEGLFNDEELQELKDLGAVVDDGDLQKEEDLRNKVAELEAKLQQLTQEREAAQTTLPSPGTLFQTPAVTEDTVNEDEGDPQPGGVRKSTVGDEAIATASSSKVVKDGEVKSPSQAKSEQGK